MLWGKYLLLNCVCVYLNWQASIPLGQHDNCPVVVSFIARHGGDRFLLDTIRATYCTLQQQVETSSSTQTANSMSGKIEAAKISKEKVLLEGAILLQ